MKYLLDTDHLSLLQRRTGPERAVLVLRIAEHSPADVASCVASFHEQSLGCHTYINRAKNPEGVIRGYVLFGEVVESFTAFIVLPFDDAASAEYQRLAGLKLRVPTLDLRIASIALSRRLTVLTRNAADFGRVPGLKFEDWTK